MPPHGTAPDEAVEPAFVLGVEDIHDAVMERLKAVSFAITTLS